MIIQNINSSQGTQGALPVKLANDSAPTVVTAAATGTSTTQLSAQQPSSEQLRNAVNDINQAMRQSNQNLEFSVDTNTKKLIVRMVDAGTGELIRQFPSEEALAIARSIDQYLHKLQHGRLLTQQA